MVARRIRPWIAPGPTYAIAHWAPELREEVLMGELAVPARPPTFGDDPQVVANDLFTTFDHPAAGRIRHHRVPARFHGSPTTFRDPAAPTLGQHSDEVVAETGRGDRIEELRAAGVIG